ncbi:MULTISPECIES: ribose-phosphate diphosphokinase [Thermaerobacter]|uniref:Ribose-phosphate pyrophosphokinase n=1 Tax=Thermaerobacter composti TaxID=554949 RepID=A0ABZ0QQ46_9FIRM|nr:MULTISPECIES: ribose-phosphate pyrophosphokinase [Thermaerobacter]PZN04712.1 MAG: ribose-phosphate pyrophosphokinase [Bacillota bacterium]QBS37145.1 ribose-phosphate pyrophosphokinase [Thermaerobacter sp. FW80]WPD19148.1 ribose-phosphate pyrophosphokinase [Thermaerobacter composti]
MAYDSGRLKLFAGSANPALARAIAQHIGVPLGDLELGRFANGEVRVSVNESVRGADVFVIQPTCHPPNDTLMELLVLLDALKRASAWRVNAVVPFYGYARQDRKTRPREPITAKLVANLLTVAGADRVVTMDLHAGQIQGFFDVPVDHLTAVPLLADYFARKRLERPVVVSPDHGGVTRARELADRLGVPIAIIDKRRPEPGVAEVMSVVGDVEGRTAIMIDDIIDSGGTIRHGAEALIALGAKAVYACCTHPVFSGNALQRLAEAPIEEIVVTDTIPLPPGAEKARVKVLSVAPIFGEAIVRIHEDLSVSRLFT